jgi:hypothetical protein
MGCKAWATLPPISRTYGGNAEAEAPARLIPADGHAESCREHPRTIAYRVVLKNSGDAVLDDG